MLPYGLNGLVSIGVSTPEVVLLPQKARTATSLESSPDRICMPLLTISGKVILGVTVVPAWVSSLYPQ